MIDLNSDQFEISPKHLLVKSETVEKSAGGIVLPSDQNVETAVVVNSGCRQYKKGNRVLVAQYMGFDYEFKDGTFKMIEEHNVLGLQLKE